MTVVYLVLCMLLLVNPSLQGTPTLYFREPHVSTVSQTHRYLLQGDISPFVSITRVSLFFVSAKLRTAFKGPKNGEYLNNTSIVFEFETRSETNYGLVCLVELEGTVKETQNPCFSPHTLHLAKEGHYTFRVLVNLLPNICHSTSPRFR